MKHEGLLLLPLLFLAFSFSLSCVAIPTTRILKSTMENPSVQDLLAGDTVNLRVNGELQEMEDVYIDGRLDLESQDYKGTGANTRHDPKTPGTA